MQGSDSIRCYPTTVALLHWVIAAAVIFLVVLGWWMQEIPKQPPGLRADAYNLHKSIGLAALLLMFARLGWRVTHRAPELPPLPLWQARTARLVHVLLYVCLFIQPLSGYLGSAFSGYPVKLFGFVLPAWAPKSDPLKDAMSVVHLVNSCVLVTALVLHIAGALKHVLDRDGLFRRMWPWGEQATASQSPRAA